MVHPEITVSACEPSSVLHVLAAAASGKANPLGRHNLMDIVLRGQCFRMADHTGATVGAYVLEVNGADVWVTAAAGRAAADLCTVLDAATKVQAQAFEAVMFRTARPGLVRKARARGFEVSEYIMRKVVQ